MLGFSGTSVSGPRSKLPVLSGLWKLWKTAVGAVEAVEDSFLAVEAVEDSCLGCVLCRFCLVFAVLPPDVLRLLQESGSFCCCCLLHVILTTR